MLCVPALRVDVLKFVVPRLSVLVPIEVTPSMNVTVPVAVPGVSAAVNMTVAPGVTGCPPVDDVRLVVVVARFTVCGKADDVDVA